MNTRSLRFGLIGWYAGCLTGVFVLFGVVLHQLLGYYLERNLAELLSRRSEQIAVSLLANVQATGEKYVVDEIQARYNPAQFDRFIRLTRAGGAVLYASGRTADFDPSGLPAAGPGNSTRVVRLADGHRLLVTARTYLSPSGGAYVIESGGPMQAIEEMLSNLVEMLLVNVPLAVLVAVGGGYYLVGRALAPVVRMARSAERITLRNLDEQLPVTRSGDELEQLSLALNHMIRRLREAVEQNQRFLADASHELRTPLTVLRGELESAVGQTAAPELRERLGSALEEVDRLVKIVEALFAISRVEAGDAPRQWTRFDLAQLAAATAEQMSLLAEDKGVRVNCKVEGNVSVEGDSARIKQVVVNLLDNAIKYTPAGGCIELSVQARGGKAVMEVADTGIGIPAGALPRVFERFYRGDQASWRDGGGAGLGLAIVKSICSAHGGQIGVQSVEGRGSHFKVELPLAGGT